jgi:hypothetical protein
MPISQAPVIGNWYQHFDKGQRFQIVAVDDDDGTIEIQHFDGDIEEIELEEWPSMSIAPCEAPENWSGAVDISEVDDYGTEVTDTSADEWEAPLRE